MPGLQIDPRDPLPSPHLERLEGRTLLAAGDPDPAFANGGAATISFPGAPFQVNDVAVQADGKVIAAGAKGSNIAVPRLNVNGTLDTTFGTGGLFESSRAPEARGVVIQPDGKIVLALGFSDADTTVAMKVGRLLASGASFDAGFGSVGIAHVGRLADNWANAVALQADGKIVVAGGWQAGNTDFILVRYNTDGSPDATFDDDGQVSLAFGADELASAVAIDYNGTTATNPYYGTIVAVGDKRPGQGQPSTNFTIGRLLSDGSPDNRFDSDGKLTSPDLTSLPTEYATGVRVQQGGKIVVTGTAVSGAPSGDFLLARYLPSGPIDSTFGPFGSGIVHDEWGGDDRALDLAPNYFGGLFVSGSRNGIAAVAAYTPDGLPETRFSGDSFMTSFGGAAHVAATLDATATPRRFVLGGGNRVGRYVDLGTVINFPGGTLGQVTSEAGGATLSITVERGDRLPTTQRVYITIGGTATAPYFSLPSSWDYTTSGINLPGFNTPPRPYVDIPPNQTFTTFSITPINDTRAEGDETITFSVSEDSTYDVGTPSSAWILIRDDDLFAPPTVAASAFLYETAPQRVTFRFDQNVAASIGADDFQVSGPGGSVPFAFAYDASLNTATLSFADVLPDGDLTARAVAAGISGPGGTMPADHVLNFFFLTGDANRDRRVNLADFNLLAANFGQTNRTFSHGDFNYDGRVNLQDFNLLAARFGQSLAPAARPGSTLPPAGEDDAADELSVLLA